MSQNRNPESSAVRAVRRVRPILSALLAASIVPAALGCAGLQGKTNEDGASKKIVAKVGEREITQAELEDASRGQMLRLEVDYKQNLYRNQQQILNYLIRSELIEAEAARRQITPFDLLEVEIRVPAEEQVTDADVEALYEEYKEQLEGDLEANREQLHTHLLRKKQEELKVAMLDRLEAEAGVESFLAYPDLPSVEITGGEQAPSKGPADAPVTIVEFSDFQCPFCRRMQPTLNDLMASYPGKVRLEYRHFPISSHPVAAVAAQGSACANEQGKFWEYHDQIFALEEELTEPKLDDIAAGIGLDIGAYGQCMKDERYAELVRTDIEVGRGVGIQGTPAFFVNGHPIYGADTESVFREVIERELSANES